MLELEKLLPKKPSAVRQLRVAELIKMTIAEALTKGEIDSKIILDNFITISNVKISPDLRNATIYITVFQSTNLKALLEELNKFSPKFRFIIAKNIKLKSAPQILFRYDDSLEQSDRINKLISSTPE